MKMKTAVVFFAAIISSMFAFAEDTCTECRQAAVSEWKKCMLSTKTEAEKVACVEQSSKLLDSCDKGEGICHVTFSELDKRDWALVLDFVKNNVDVIREVETTRYAMSKASYKAPGELRPSSYLVSIIEGKQPTHVIVDFSRSSGEAQLKLVCISHMSPLEFRGPLREICNQ